MADSFSRHSWETGTSSVLFVSLEDDVRRRNGEWSTAAATTTRPDAYRWKFHDKRVRPRNLNDFERLAMDFGNWPYHAQGNDEQGIMNKRHGSKKGDDFKLYAVMVFCEKLSRFFLRFEMLVSLKFSVSKRFPWKLCAVDCSEQRG